MSWLRRYVFSTDHKVIGQQYIMLAFFSVFLGIVLSLIMRFHLIRPDAKVQWFAALWPTGAQGGIMTPELYLSLMTIHGTLMVFFVLTTAPQSGSRRPARSAVGCEWRPSARGDRRPFRLILRPFSGGDHLGLLLAARRLAVDARPYLG